MRSLVRFQLAPLEPSAPLGAFRPRTPRRAGSVGLSTLARCRGVGHEDVPPGARGDRPGRDRRGGPTAAGLGRCAAPAGWLARAERSRAALMPGGGTVAVF